MQPCASQSAALARAAAVGEFVTRIWREAETLLR
jgi:hypothetical protein